MSESTPEPDRAAPSPQRQIASLLLPRRSGQPPLLHANRPVGPGGAKVVGNALISFLDEIPAEDQAAISDLTLLAMLNSDVLFPDKTSNMDKWYANYNHVLGVGGMNVQGDDYSQYDTGSTTLEVDKVVLEILESLLAEDEAGAVKKAIGALKGEAEAAENKAAKLWDRQSLGEKQGSFSVGVARLTPGNLVVLKTSFFSFTTSTTTTHVLWTKWSSSSSSVYTGHRTMVFNREQWQRVAETVKTKLGDRGNEMMEAFEV
ncbi:hypothetical protein [Streptomyces sp. NPDC090112]|uniref:hypothetical protein n=1 Tax=Streptomyces sp. NPDC090112 TaxID=3365949 RepID=UPI0037FDA071